jgi:hypothetical protein
MEQSVIQMINAYRGQNGRAALTANAALMRAGAPACTI